MHEACRLRSCFPLAGSRVESSRAGKTADHLDSDLQSLSSVRRRERECERYCYYFSFARRLLSHSSLCLPPFLSCSLGATVLSDSCARALASLLLPRTLGRCCLAPCNLVYHQHRGSRLVSACQALDSRFHRRFTHTAYLLYSHWFSRQHNLRRQAEREGEQEQNNRPFQRFKVIVQGKSSNYRRGRREQ